MLPETFYSTDALDLSQKLLGKLLVRKLSEGEIVCRITETEAYMGVTDKGCHAYGGKITQRTRTMYLPSGHAYIYLIYGMYNCLNVVANVEGVPEAVLIRGAEPVGDHRTDEADEADEAFMSMKLDGPGKLCRALKIDRSLNALPLYTGEELYISDDGYKGFDISSGPRINIGYAQEYKDIPWRFFISR
jgi:DNA-3-methyladenine glycosylase